MRKGCLTLCMLLLAAAALAIEKSQTVVVIGGDKFYVHTVQPGETIYSLARTYGVGEPVIVQYNPSAAVALRAGERLKIPFAAPVAGQPSERKLRKRFDTHTVAQGETLYAIARRYAIPIETVIQDNPGLDPIRLHPGQNLLIRRKERGTEPASEVLAGWEQYRDALNSVARDGYGYHLVLAGETFYGLARRFKITEAELSALNGGLQPADLKAGAIVKVPGTALPQERIQRGEDTPGSGELFPANARERALADTTARWERLPAEGDFPAFGQGGTRPADSLGYDAFRMDGQPVEVTFRPLEPGETLHAALLLPLAVDGVANANYLEFYQGFLLGLDSVKRMGHSVQVDLYNTGRDAEKVRGIVESEAFGEVDLIVGPVYEEMLGPVVRFAEERGVPVVSPLAHLTRTHSDAVFQMAPAAERKYEKAADLIDGSKRITFIYSDHTDREFEGEMRALLGQMPYGEHHYKYEHGSVVARRGSSPSDLTPLLHNQEDNVFVVLADNEVEVDRILAALASAYTGIVSRGGTPPRFVVLGNPRWNRYNNLDRTLFFKDRLVFFPTYHAKRDAAVVRRFDSEYIRAFGSLPTLYSYRGYDAALLFAPAMFGDIGYDLEGESYTPLQTTYVFGQEEGSATHVNRNWMRINYEGDYTIRIE